jgi:hypothetical protein
MFRNIQILSERCSFGKDGVNKFAFLSRKTFSVSEKHRIAVFNALARGKGSYIEFHIAVKTLHQK